MIVGPITSVFSCLSSKFLKSLAWRPKFKLHFSIWWVPDPPQKKSILLVSTDHHIPKVKKLYQQCIQDSLSGASAWVSRNNSKSHIEKVCPFLIFSWLFWWSPKREPQFGAGISWTPDAPGLCVEQGPWQATVCRYITMPQLSFHCMPSVAAFRLLRERPNCHLLQCYKVSFSNKVKFKGWADVNKFICKKQYRRHLDRTELWKRSQDDIGKVSGA